MPQCIFHPIDTPPEALFEEHQKNPNHLFFVTCLAKPYGLKIYYLSGKVINSIATTYRPNLRETVDEHIANALSYTTPMVPKIDYRNEQEPNKRAIIKQAWLDHIFSIMQATITKVADEDQKPRSPTVSNAAFFRTEKAAEGTRPRSNAVFQSITEESTTTADHIPRFEQ